MAGVALRSVTKTFGSVHALRDVTQEMKEGELTVVLGPSGCGKSTLLRIVAGLDDVTQGEVEIGGRRVTEVAPAKRGIAMVFQSYALYPHMTVFENMAFGLRLAKTDRGTIAEEVQEAARLLRIDHLLDRKPRALSGGQRQRVAMGRAIVRDPDVFLFDEPLSNLDAALRVEMRLEVARLQERFGATMVYVTHDQVEAMTLAHTIVVMRDGRIEQAGAPMDVYHAPRNRFVAGFIGSPGMNFLDATVAETDSDTVALSFLDDRRLTVPVEPEGVRPGDEVALGIRPEDITLDAGDHAAVKGEVGMVERLGAETYLHIVLADGQRLVARVPGELRMRRGETVRLGLPPAVCHVFRPDGSALPRRSR